MKVGCDICSDKMMRQDADVAMMVKVVLIVLFVDMSGGNVRSRKEDK